MATAIDRSGKAVDIPDEQLQSEFLAGRVGLPGDTVGVKDPLTGTIKSIPVSDAAEHFRQGYGFVSPTQLEHHAEEEKYSGLGPTLEAGLAGAVSGATFGGATAAARKFAPGLADEAAKLKEYHPTAYGTGSVAGSIAPLALTGGLGAAGEGAEAVGGVAKAIGAARSIAGQAAWGGAFGAGQAIDESALGDKELTAEQLLAGAKHGAIWGAATGAGLLGLGKIASRGAEALTAEGGIGDQLVRKLSDFTEKWKGGGLETASKAETKELADLAQKFETAKQQTGREFVRNRIQEVKSNLANTDSASVHAALADSADTATSLIEGALQDPKRYTLTKNFQQAQGVIDTFKRDAAKLLEENKGPEELFQLGKEAKGQLQSLAKWDKSYTATERPSAQVLRDIQGEFKNTLEALEPREAELNASYAATAGDKGVDATFYKYFGNKKTGGVEPARIQAMVNGLAKGDLSAVSMRDAFEDWVNANRAHAEQVAKTAEALPTGAGKATLSDLLQRQAETEQGLMPGLEDAISARQAAQAEKPKFGEIPFLGTGVIGSIGKRLTAPMETLAAAAEKAAAVTKTIQSGVKAFVNSSIPEKIARFEPQIPASVAAFHAPFYGARASKDDDHEAAYSRIVDRIDHLSQNPQKVAMQLGAQTKRLGLHAPVTAFHAQVKETQKLDYLQSKIPRDPSLGQRLQKSNWKPTPAQRSKFMRHVVAVNDPLSTLDELRQGILTKEGVEAFKTTSPKLYQQAGVALISAVSKSNTPLSLSQLGQVALFLGQPVDPLMQPQTVAMLQSNFMAQQPGPSQGPPQGAPSKLGELGFSGRGSSPTESITAGISGAA